MATLSMGKAALLQNPKEFDAAKWRYPVAEEPIKIGQVVSMNFETEKVSIYRLATLVPPDGIAASNAEVGEVVLICARILPGDHRYWVFRIPDQQSN